VNDNLDEDDATMDAVQLPCCVGCHMFQKADEKTVMMQLLPSLDSQCHTMGKVIQVTLINSET